MADEALLRGIEIAVPLEPKEVARCNTLSVKWAGATEYFSGPSGLVPFHIADMDFAVAEPVSRALQERVAHPVYGYTAAAASSVSAVTSWYLRRHDVKVSHDWVVMLPFGARSALSLAVRTLVEPGHAVATLSPSYPGIRKMINGARCRPVEIVLEKGVDGYVIEWGMLAKALHQESVRAFVLCSPHNPTGRVWSREEISRIKLLCAESGVYLISDEVHSDIVYGQSRHTPAIIDNADSLPIVMIHGPGKGFNVSGIPASFAIIPDSVVRSALVDELGAFGFHQGGMLCDLIHEACFDKCEQWLDATIAYLEETRDEVMGRLEDAPDVLRCHRPDATFLLWLDFNSSGLEESQIERMLVTRAKVGLLPGRTFGLGGGGHFRLNIATGRDRVIRALDMVIACLRSTGLRPFGLGID